MSNVVYVGHLPFGFFENQLKEYFTQFGKVVRLRISRSKKTGKSKGYGFIQFANAKVAEIAASTMNNYLMFEKILKCHVVPREKVHRSLWIGAGVEFNPVDRGDQQAKQINEKKSLNEEKQHQTKLVKKLRKQNKLLKSLGVDYSFPVPRNKGIRP